MCSNWIENFYLQLFSVRQLSYDSREKQQSTSSDGRIIIRTISNSQPSAAKMSQECGVKGSLATIKRVIWNAKHESKCVQNCVSKDVFQIFSLTFWECSFYSYFFFVKMCISLTMYIVCMYSMHWYSNLTPYET